LFGQVEEEACVHWQHSDVVVDMFRRVNVLLSQEWYGYNISGLRIAFRDFLSAVRFLLARHRIQNTGEGFVFAPVVLSRAIMEAFVMYPNLRTCPHHAVCLRRLDHPESLLVAMGTDVVGK
jgi:hypothetical protein